MTAPFCVFSNLRSLTGLSVLGGGAALLLFGSGCENPADPLAPETGGAGSAVSAYGERYTDPERERQREETYLRMNDERGYPRDPY